MGFLLHVGANAICPHAGQISPFTTNTRVLVSGQPVVTSTDIFTIIACPFTLPGGSYHPCLIVKWLTPSSRIRLNGRPVVLQNSTGVCQSSDQTPQGAPTVTTTQTRVTGV